MAQALQTKACAATRAKQLTLDETYEPIPRKLINSTTDTIAIDAAAAERPETGLGEQTIRYVRYAICVVLSIPLHGFRAQRFRQRGRKRMVMLEERYKDLQK